MKWLPFFALAPLLVAAFAGCLSDDRSASGGPGEEPTIPTVDSAASLASYLTNVSEPIPGLTVLDSILIHARIPAIDGVLLDAWLVRPSLGQRVPVVLEVTPYYAGGSPIPVTEDSHLFGHIADVLVSRGYAYGIVSVRGTGLSEGCFTQGGPTEAKDTAEVVEYFARQTWSNGNVGVIGVSYVGTTPQDVWVEAPPSLKTIVPIAGISDFYKYNFVNGVHINVQGFGFNTYYWGLVGVGWGSLNGVPDPRDALNVPGSITGEACAEQIAVQEAGVSSTLDGNKDSYWMVRDFHAELLQDWDKERASVFYVHGLQDWNVKPHMMEDWLPAIQATGVPYKIWLGQWQHAWPDGSGETCGEMDFETCRADWWETALVAWFDQFLKGRETGILNAPPVQVQDDDLLWRHELNWPPLDVEWLKFYPQDDGTLGTTGFGEGEATYNDAQGGLAAPPGATTQVLWVSEPLEADLHISGMPRFIGEVTASGQRASLILTLAERTSSEDRSFNFAALSLNHARSLAQGDPDIAGQTQEIDVRFFPQDDVVHAGNRLVLIASGNAVGSPNPSLQPVATGSDITIDLGSAKLKIPVDRSIVYEDPQPYTYA